MQTSTPQGEEVFAWLAEQSLSIYSAVFARHKLDTLRKVSLLTPTQLDTINADLNVVTGSSTSETVLVQEGQRVTLGEAVAALKNSPQAMSLKERLRTYRDPTVSGLNLVGAQNQLEGESCRKSVVSSSKCVCGQQSSSMHGIRVIDVLYLHAWRFVRVRACAPSPCSILTCVFSWPGPCADDSAPW